MTGSFVEAWSFMMLSKSLCTIERMSILISLLLCCYFPIEVKGIFVLSNFFFSQLTGKIRIFVSGSK